MTPPGWRELAGEQAEARGELEGRIRLALSLLSHRFPQTSDVLAVTRALQGMPLGDLTDMEAP